jgi:hypothetical protein
MTFLSVASEVLGRSLATCRLRAVVLLCRHHFVALLY